MNAFDIKLRGLPSSGDGSVWKILPEYVYSIDRKGLLSKKGQNIRNLFAQLALLFWNNEWTKIAILGNI